MEGVKANVIQKLKLEMLVSSTSCGAQGGAAPTSGGPSICADGSGSTTARLSAGPRRPAEVAHGSSWAPWRDLRHAARPCPSSGMPSSGGDGDPRGGPPSTGGAPTWSAWLGGGGDLSCASHGKISCRDAHEGKDPRPNPRRLLLRGIVIWSEKIGGFFLSFVCYSTAALRPGVRPGGLAPAFPRPSCCSPWSACFRSVS